MKMNRVLWLVVASALSISVSSCRKCVTCSDCNDGVEFQDGDNKLCTSDFDSSEDYDAAVAILESDFHGCSCSK